MRNVLILFCLALLPGLLWAVSQRADGGTIYERIARLQEEARQVAASCGGDEQFEAIHRQIAELQAQLPRDNRGSLDQGGDNCATASVITTFPFCDTGTTIGAANNYTPPCVAGSNAPDVVYIFTPATNMTVSISLCGSSYNTVLYINRQFCPDIAESPVCCNDDFCGQQSCCPAINLIAGVPYYIIVDGAGTAAGNYTLHVGPQGTCGTGECPCTVTCPTPSLSEGEGCPPGNPDNYNAGCYWFPFNATPLPCNQTICGSSYWDTAYQDHDAYIITLTQRDSLRWCMYAEFDVQMDVHQFFSAG